MLLDEIENPKLKSNKRTLVLKVRDNEKPKSSSGLIDPRLFSGENELYAVMDDVNCMWYLKYKQGGLPESLRNHKFTNFSTLLNYTKKYFLKRNIEIAEVID